MRPPSYYNTLANASPTGSGGNNRTSNQQLRSSFANSSSASYVTRSHLPFVSQSMLVAHCFTGAGSSTRPYGGRQSHYAPAISSASSLSRNSYSPTSYSSSYTRPVSASRSYHYQPIGGGSSSSSIGATASGSGSSGYLSAGYTSLPPRSPYLIQSQASSPSSLGSSRVSSALVSSSALPAPGLSSSSLSSSSSSSFRRPSATSYYKPIKLRERPLLTQISRQLNTRYIPSSQAGSRVHSVRKEARETGANCAGQKPLSGAQTGLPPSAGTPAKRANPVEDSSLDDNNEEQKLEESWSSDIGRNISRNKYLIKFREFDKRASIAPIELLPTEPGANQSGAPQLGEPQVTARSEETETLNSSIRGDSGSGSGSGSNINHVGYSKLEEPVVAEAIVLEADRGAGEKNRTLLDDQSESGGALTGGKDGVDMRIPIAANNQQEERPQKNPAPGRITEERHIERSVRESVEKSVDKKSAKPQSVDKQPIAAKRRTDKQQVGEKGVVRKQAEPSSLEKQQAVRERREDKVAAVATTTEQPTQTMLEKPIEKKHQQLAAIDAEQGVGKITTTTTTTTTIKPQTPPSPTKADTDRQKLVISGQLEQPKQRLDSNNCDKTIGGQQVNGTEEEKKKAPKEKRNIKLKIKTLTGASSTKPAKERTKQETGESVDASEPLVGKPLKSSKSPKSSPKQSPEVVQPSDTSPTNGIKTKVKRLAVKSSKSKEKAASTANKDDENAAGDGNEDSVTSKPAKPKAKLAERKALAEKQQANEVAAPPLAKGESLLVSSEKSEVEGLQLSPEAATATTITTTTTISTINTPEADGGGSKLGQTNKRIRFREYHIDDFNFLSVLGHGGWGFVILAELKEHDACFAVKCIKKITIVEDDDFDSIMIERKVLALGNIHPFICKLFCTFETDGYLFFVMEYCAGGDLMFHVQREGKFTESRCRFYAAEIICAIRFLHNRHIIYRDLKLDNILLDSRGHVRLVDFGMCQCRTYREEMLPSNFCGTPEYISPEIIKGVPYNHSVDWWSFGVLLYEMAVGKMPFRGNDENELLWNVCYEQIHYPMFLTKELTTLLQLLLEREPAKRMGMSTCKAGDIYEQPWFRGVDWRAMEEMRVPPPFVPEVRSKRDVQNFDADFTESAPELSPVDESTLQRIDQSQFQKFPYTNPDIFTFD